MEGFTATLLQVGKSQVNDLCELIRPGPIRPEKIVRRPRCAEGIGTIAFNPRELHRKEKAGHVTRQ